MWEPGSQAAGGRNVGAAGSPVDTRLLHNWKDARERGIGYLAALDVAPAEHEELLGAAVHDASASAWEAGSTAVGATLAALRQRLTGGLRGRPPFLHWRLAREFGHVAGDLVSLAMPALRRRPMWYEPIRRGAHAKEPTRLDAASVLYGSPLRRLRRTLPWTRAAHWRRFLLVLLVLVPTTVASGFMVNVLPNRGGTWVEVATVAFFGVLFGWVSVGFWTALFGFHTLARGRDRFAITGLAEGDPAEPPAPEEAPDA